MIKYMIIATVVLLLYLSVFEDKVIETKIDITRYNALVCAGIQEDYENRKPDCDKTLTSSGGEK